MPVKAYDYIVECKQPDYKLVNLVSQIMLFLSLIAFGSSPHMYPITFKAVYLYLIMTGILVLLVIGNRKQRHEGNANYRFALSLAAIGWIAQPGDWKWVAAIFILSAILERQVKFPIEYAFDEKQVVFNSLPKRMYDWKELNNVVLKDGLLTIDFKNNRIIQKEINEHISDKLETDFNDFCRRCLLSAQAA
ncbi:hypothetical protein [Sediminibacterium soli]|uniref:hypothetical protein n=1 Tax=Sediminibacterium soli TaxID=2698829 RepID=UPI00137981DB|nr:hypothetical protein [Sediminibacterium soli]NCI46506.1 hypothetical protein [Sediminibacterium soli]